MSLDELTVARVAVLVIDMQNAFCHPNGTLGISGVDISDCRTVIDPIRRLALAAGRADVPVIWTIQEHLPEDARRARKRLAAHTARRARVSALAGTWDAEIVDELADLAPTPTLLIRKHRFGAFHETRLDILLGMLGRDAVFVTGVTANACVETTIREAYLRDYDVVAVSDCIGAIDPRWKQVAQEVWAHFFAEPADSRDVIAWLNRASERSG